MAEQIITKQCPRCKEIKTISEFSKDRTCTDSLDCYCKVCRNAVVKQYQQTEKGKASIKRYAQSDKRKAYQKAYQKQYQRTEKCKTTRKHYFIRHPEHRKARDAVSIAITVGRLPRLDTLLCHYCPKPAQQYHHWHGYAPEHWLDVVPVCRDCHSKQT